MKIKRPNAFLYFLAYVLFYPILKICYSIKIDRSGLDIPKGPYIMLSNHGTMFDFLVVMLAFYPRQRLNAVAAHKFYYYWPFNKLLPMLGCIPKNMFDPDVRSIIGMKQVLKRGDAVLLFPEGRCSVGHDYSCIHKSTGKLIKKLGVPVISARMDGLTNCSPLWRRYFRFGRMHITYKNLFSVDDLASMTPDEINAAINARLSGAEGSVASRRPLETRFRRQLAQGLHKFLYYCPECGAEFTTRSEKNTIHCSACGFSADLDKREMLHIAGTDKSMHISQWYKKQMQHEMDSLCDDMEPIVFNTKLKLPASKPGGGMEYSGQGTMRIDPEGWHFEGELYGEKASLFFPVDTVPATSFDYDKNLQIFHGGSYYMFIPEDLRKCIKYNIIAECLHRKFAKQPLMTP